MRTYNILFLLPLRSLIRLAVLFIVYFILSSCSHSDRSIRIVFAGDMMLDRGTRTVIEQKCIDHLFENVTSLFHQQDIVMVNFENPFCTNTEIASNKLYCFRGDPDWLFEIKKAGITHAVFANNHIGDYGREGLKETMAYLSRNDIHFAGSDSSFLDPCKPLLIDKKGSRIAIFSNSLLYQKDNPGFANENFPQLNKRISSFKKLHPDYCIIISLHWGIEMDDFPTAEQKRQAHELIKAGADLIIGHHPHVVQPIEMYEGKYICYSLGNFMFDTNKDPGNKGILACFVITDNKISLDKIIPFTLIDSKPFIMNEKDSHQFLEKKGIYFDN